MAISTEITANVKYNAERLLEEAKSLCNETFNPGRTFVTIELYKGNVTVLKELCNKVDVPARDEIISLLEKAQRKLTLAEQVNRYARDPSESAADPRVKRILDKIVKARQSPIPKQQEEHTKLHAKLIKWNGALHRCADSSLNELTNQQIEKGRGLIREIDMQFLTIAPVFVTFDYSLLDKRHDKVYQDMPNLEACKKLASAFYAKKYLELALENEDRRFDKDGIGWYHQPAVHEHTAEFIQKHKPSEGIPAKALFEDTYLQVLNEVQFPEESFSDFSFPSDATEGLIQKKLENLIDLKNVHHYKSMGAFIEAPPQMLALAFHASGRISLVNPCGRAETQNAYEANFANARQAANYLSVLIREMKPNQPILLKPYCHSWVIGHDEQSVQGEDHEHPILLHNSSAIEPKILIDVCPEADRLNRIIEHLSQNNENGFLHALSYIQEVKNHTAVFPMTDQTEQSVFDRCCFHLYHIQDKETPDKVDRNDHNWGLNAFQTEGLSTPEQKLRAVQRTQVEILFVEIERGIGTLDNASFRLLLDALEALKMHANDLPKDQGNPAHALFGKLYEKYVDERKHNSDLEDPQLAKFRGDFGRNVFRGEIKAEIPFLVKHRALQEIVQAFKAAWRI